MDILYTLKAQDSCEELIYSIRSLSNLPHDKVVVVGVLPKCINPSTVTYIPYRASGSRFEITTANIKRACQDTRLSDDFILMNDDFFVLQPIIDPHVGLAVDQGTITDTLQRFLTRYGKMSNYMTYMRQTKEFLQKNYNIQEPIAYELHVPMILNKEKFLQIVSIIEASGIAGLHAHKRSIYGNLTGLHYTTIKDPKIFMNTIFKREDLYKLPFLSCSDRGWPRVKQFLTNLFPQKSKYEV